MPNLIKKSCNFCWVSIEQFFADNCLTRAAALTYATLLSLVPLMTTSFILLKKIPFFQQLGEKVQDFIFANFVATSAKAILSYLQNFVEQANKLTGTSFMFLFVTAVLMIFNMEISLNHIWRVKKQRKFVVAFFVYLAIIVLCPILIAIALGMTTYLISLPLISNVAKQIGLNKAMLIVSPYVLTYLAFSLLYWVMPNCKVPLKSALIGGFVAALLFEFSKYGFGLYVHYFPTYQLLYGALATIPIFLVWVYLCWSIILLGAIVGYQVKSLG